MTYFTLAETDLETDPEPNGYKTQARIPTPYFCIGQESESLHVTESGNVFKPLGRESVTRWLIEARGCKRV